MRPATQPGSVGNSATVNLYPGGAPATLESPTIPKEGQILKERFKLLEMIGRGGMGMVFRAKDLHMDGEPVIAIKLLSAELRNNADAQAALQRECRKVRMLAHDSIVRVFEFYRSDDQAFITMELLEGESLDQMMKKFPRGMTMAKAWPIISNAGGALAYAHRQKPPYVHYDFKPSNIFMTRQGQVKVLDFGVARAVRTGGDGGVQTLFDPTRVSAFTPKYASCEMMAYMDPDPRDDVYALACFTYELLGGKHPFGGMPALQARTQKLKPAAIASLNAQQNKALLHGLEFERADRTRSVDQFLNELSPDNSTAKRFSGSRVALIAALSLLVVAVAARTYQSMHARHLATAVSAATVAQALSSSSVSSTQIMQNDSDVSANSQAMQSEESSVTAAAEAATSLASVPASNDSVPAISGPVKPKVIKHAHVLSGAASIATPVTQQAIDGKAACAQIFQACKEAGFVLGGMKRGNGIQADCVTPLLKGTTQPNNASRSLPTVPFEVIRACRAQYRSENKGFGESRTERRTTYGE